MAEYIKFIVIWAVFMVALGVITVLVPKLAARIDKVKEKYKVKQDSSPLGQTSFMEPAEGQTEQKENQQIAEKQRTE